MKKFYDIHLHVMDLSHPNLSAFLSREGLFESFINWKTRLILFLAPIAAVLPEKFLVDQLRRLEDKNPFFRNTLAFYEIPMEYQFLLLDYFLKKPDRTIDRVVGPGNEFKMDGETYDRMVLCPLAIDFGYKNLDERGVFYNKAPFKPIAKQLNDLFYAIYTYYRFDLEPDENPRKLRLKEISKPLSETKQTKLFEIYPFMGLNTRNYTLKKLVGADGKTGLLDKYFSDFDAKETPEERRDRLYRKMGTFSGKMYEKDEQLYKDIFAGIKVYPPLGFDPYPDDEHSEEFDKVAFLYEYCIRKRIPIMTHCSDGGFKVGLFEDWTDPGKKWKKVLDRYPELTLCFAHFGSQRSGSGKWRKTVIDCTEKQNVYADVSCNVSTMEYYENLNRLIHDSAGNLREKILFGSDFSINMLATKMPSYNRYLKTFIHAGSLKDKQKLCTDNPEAFLFGKTS